MVNKLDKVIHGLYLVIRAVLIVLLISMIAILMAHIWFRYVLNHSLTWSEELLRIMLVWFGMLSVSILAVRREHVAITVFKEHMPKKLGNFFGKFTQALTVVICLAVIMVGWQYMAGAAGHLTPALRMPYQWAYAAIPVSFIPVTLFEFRNLLEDLTGQGPYAAIEKPAEDLGGGVEDIQL